MKQILLAWLVAPMVAMATPASAPAPNPGVIFEIETVTTPGTPPERVDAAIEGTNARMTMAGQGTDAIFRGDRREMVIITHGSKSYMVMDEATMKQLASRVSQAMSQMEQMMQNMPPEQRARMEEMMKGRGMTMAPQAAAKAEVRRTAERATHSGFATTKYEVFRAGRKTQELWVTPWNSVDGFSEAQPVFESMADFFQGVMSSLGTLGGAADTQAFSYIKELAGFPVVTQNFDENGAPTSRSTLLAVRRQAVPPAQFEPPAGYQRQAIPGGQ
jgi:hypothetical protein